MVRPVLVEAGGRARHAFPGLAARRFPGRRLHQPLPEVFRAAAAEGRAGPGGHRGRRAWVWRTGGRGWVGDCQLDQFIHLLALSAL